MKWNRIVGLVLALGLGCATWSSAQERMTREEYIQKYKKLAVEQMEIYGIPASIKLAQALHESDNGNSRLARLANNHFGIKCKSSWTGPTIEHDDDAPGECFRKYGSAEESYLDHSEFLDKSARYQDLFKLDPKDYKGWAYGLRKAGYATNPKYAEILIKIIEENRLYLLDEGKDINAPLLAEERPQPQQPVPVRQPEPKPQETQPQPQAPMVDIDNYSVSVSGRGGNHTVYHNNGSEFILTSAGDTYASIASEFGLTVSKLIKYNDLDGAGDLRPGTMLYLKTKAKRSENGKLIHIAKEGETMHSISQAYGIRLKNLCNINRRSKDSAVKAGQQIRLM